MDFIACSCLARAGPSGSALFAASVEPLVQIIASSSQPLAHRIHPLKQLLHHLHVALHVSERFSHPLLLRLIRDGRRLQQLLSDNRHCRTRGTVTMPVWMPFCASSILPREAWTSGIALPALLLVRYAPFLKVFNIPALVHPQGDAADDHARKRQAELLKNKDGDVPSEFGKGLREVVSAPLVQPRAGARIPKRDQGVACSPRPDPNFRLYRW